MYLVGRFGIQLDCYIGTARFQHIAFRCSVYGNDVLFKTVAVELITGYVGIMPDIALRITFILIGNRVEPAWRIPEIQNIDASGDYIDFKHISVTMQTYMPYYKSFKMEILLLFPDASSNEFWKQRLQHYFVKRLYPDLYFSTDLHKYLTIDRRRCRDLFIVSSEPSPVVKGLLEKQGLLFSENTMLQLIHRLKHANLYTVRSPENCNNYLNNKIS